MVILAESGRKSSASYSRSGSDGTLRREQQMSRISIVSLGVVLAGLLTLGAYKALSHGGGNALQDAGDVAGRSEERPAVGGLKSWGVAKKDIQSGTGSTGDEAPSRRVTTKEVIANNDRDGDGVITKQEASESRRSLIQMWDSYDLNRDDKVDAEEIAAASVAGRPTTERLKEIIIYNDLNDDGVVTRDEAAKTNKMLIKQWDMYDINKDGMVNLAEMAKASGI